MPEHQDELFSTSDLPTVAPWLTKGTCRQLTADGLFAPRGGQQETDPGIPHMNLYDLIAVSAVRQVLRCGLTAEQLLQALHSPASFRCDDFSDEDLLFFTTGTHDGQRFTRFLEVVNADATVIVRHFLNGDVNVEFVPDDLLGPKDYRGETLTGVGCKEIRDLIRTNIGSAIERGSEQGNSRDNGQVKKSSA